MGCREDSGDEDGTKETTKLSNEETHLNEGDRAIETKWATNRVDTRFGLGLIFVLLKNYIIKTYFGLVRIDLMRF